MTRQRIVVALLAIGLAGAVALAEVCPLCLQEISSGEKYCSRHKAELVAKRLNSSEEQQIVNELKSARETYRAKLEALEKFYKERANADGLEKIEAEIADFNSAKHFAGVQWEDSLADVAAKEDVKEANELLAQADKFRGGLHPFSRGDRLQKAATLYQEILLTYPTSSVTDEAAFGLGEIYSSGSVKDYKRAVKFYDIAYRADPATTTDALIRAAKVCDSDLAEYEQAAFYYWLAARMDSSVVDKKMSEIRLKELQKKGFGVAYKFAAETEETQAPQGTTEAK